MAGSWSGELDADEPADMDMDLDAGMDVGGLSDSCADTGLPPIIKINSKKMNPATRLRAGYACFRTYNGALGFIVPCMDLIPHFSRRPSSFGSRILRSRILADSITIAGRHGLWQGTIIEAWYFSCYQERGRWHKEHWWMRISRSIHGKSIVGRTFSTLSLFDIMSLSTIGTPSTFRLFAMCSRGTPCQWTESASVIDGQ